MSILIVEGPDLSGKTYAISKVAKHFNSGYILKNCYKPKKVEDSSYLYFRYWHILSLVTSVEDQDQLIILDRFYPSQMVYSYLRGEDEMYNTELQKIEQACVDCGAVLLYLDTPLEILELRYKDRGDEHIKIEQLKELKERYDHFIRKTKLTTLRVNTLEKHWLKFLAKDIEKLIEVE